MTSSTISPSSPYAAFLRAHRGQQPPPSSGIIYSLWLKEQRDHFFQQKFGTDRPELAHACIFKDLCRQSYIAETAEEFHTWLQRKCVVRRRKRTAAAALTRAARMTDAR